MNIAYCRFHLRGILTKLGHFQLIKRKFTFNPAKNPSIVSIYFIKRFVKSHSFQETKASGTVSSEANRADKIILNICGIAV